MPVIQTKYEVQRLEAHNLIEQGLSQKEVATQIGLSEKTIGKWMVRFGWIKNNSLAQKKRLAKTLVVVEGFTQKGASAIVGVTEKTVGHWAKIGNWKQKNVGITNYQGFEKQMDEFLLYVASHSPKLEKQLQPVWQAYLKAILSV